VLKKLPIEKKIYFDEETGGEIWKMTDGEAVSHSCYQEVEAFTEDERFVVFSSNRSGNFQLYRAELDGGELAQLSDVQDYGSISFGMARNGCEVFYTAGWRIYGVDVATGEDRVVVDLEGRILNPPNNSAAVALSGNGDRCLVSFRRGDRGSTISMVTIETGELEELVPWNDHLTHG
jgi:Tol biopolymer transport system component